VSLFFRYCFFHPFISLALQKLICEGDKSLILKVFTSVV
jgi:hypothetical protein